MWDSIKRKTKEKTGRYLGDSKSNGNSTSKAIEKYVGLAYIIKKIPILGVIFYWIKKTPTVGLLLILLIFGSFIVLINAAIEWSNHNPVEAMVIAGSIITFILLSLFVIKNKRISIFLFLLFSSIYMAYLYYTVPEAGVIVQEIIEEGVSKYNEVRKAVQDSP